MWGKNYLKYILWLCRILVIKPRPATKEGDAGSKMAAFKLLHISRNMIRWGKRSFSVHLVFYSLSRRISLWQLCARALTKSHKVQRDRVTWGKYQGQVRGGVCPPSSFLLEVGERFCIFPSYLWLNHNCNKILKSDWLSTTLISALIVMPIK